VSVTTEANTAREEAENFKSVARKEIEEKMGHGKVIVKVFDQIEKYAKTDVPILFEGETGTGKELIANYLWKNSSRKDMRTLNCGSLSSELADSELFGHKKGSFTGADSDTIGLVKTMDNGILFLDEINSLPLEVQVKLLRVIENGTFIRKGDTTESKVNVRIIAAGNKSFQNLIEKGEFREDLYERFRKRIYVPNLKERIEDIDHFIDHFIDDESNQQGKKVFISKEARKILSESDWERNVRQLKNTIANMVTEVEMDNKTKTFLIRPELVRECLKETGRSKSEIPNNDFTLQTAIDRVTKQAILRALEKTGGHNEQAIKELRIARGTYYKEKERLGIN
jgi:two-component system NtrC family response regulator/two-component system response regulator AtoC